MAYLDSLDHCVGTLEHCNETLHTLTTSLSSLSRTFPRTEAVVRCERKYELTTARDINKAQTLISKEAVPFLFRQVDQLEGAIEAIRGAHEVLGQRVDEQQGEYGRLMEGEASMGDLQKSLKAEQAALADEQASLLNAKSLVAAKERDLAELNRVRAASGRRSGGLEEAGKVDAEIIRVRRMIAEIEHETAGIPTDDQIRDSQEVADKYLVLDSLRQQLSQVSELPVDADFALFMEAAMARLELLENKVFVPWWDHGSAMQVERMGFITRLLRYFYKEHGSVMQAIVDTLLDHQSMSVDELRRELSSIGHSTGELPLLLGHLKTIGAVVSETTTVAGKQVMTVQLDFAGIADDTEACDEMDEAEEGQQ
ncbi:hypothetical protein GGF46_004347 [Coemansia sp. RSA 552]|nr:hypothetical protein GGF46_004347 [Coemansia sp. RSA 552]